MKPPNVLVIGSINMDLVVRSARIPRPGETVLGGAFLTAPGGKGANQAVAAARLGARCRLIGKVGTDGFGNQLRENLKQAGVDIQNVETIVNKPTGVALILVDQAGENAISVASGANHEFKPDDLDRLSHCIAGADVCLLQLELPVPVVLRALSLCRKHGARTVLDTAPAPSPPVPDGLFGADLISPNRDEARRLTGLDVDPDRPETVQAAGQKLHDRGAARVVIKLGSAGAYWSEGNQAGFEPAVHITPADTTAAGDAFTAALAIAWAGGEPLGRATRFANGAGAAACLSAGAQPSMPTRTRVAQLLESK